jgi:ABC-type cobalamin transport system permease subunit
MTRRQKFFAFLGLAIVGGLGITFSSHLVFGPAHHAAPDLAHVALGTLIVACAMMWALYFAFRAYNTQDEFIRQRGIEAFYWGGFSGLIAACPAVVFITIGGFGALSKPEGRFLIIGYLLPMFFVGAGTVVARLWIARRDRRA